MTLMNFIAFFGLLTGCFIIFSISPLNIIDLLGNLFKSKKPTIKEKIEEATNKKKQKGLRLLIQEAKQILIATNKSNQFNMLCIFSFVFFLLGAMIAVSINNYILIPVLAGGLSLIPFWYVKFTGIFYKKHLNVELETALSVITTSYMRSESIITAVEENINYINHSVSEVFRSFLTETKLINSNIKMALEVLKFKIDNDVYREWVDAVIACQEDKSLKSTLIPIVSKLSDIRIVGAELDYLLYEPMKEFITMAILLIGNVPLMYFLNRSWYETLMNTSVGKVILTLCTLVIFISLSAAIRLTKPIEYRKVQK
ncbi:UNVERIFIED_CONTAM: hypothetical protein Cloal_0218 [Acetivibrio alkalicellulosi]